MRSPNHEFVRDFMLLNMARIFRKTIITKLLSFFMTFWRTEDPYVNPDVCLTSLLNWQHRRIHYARNFISSVEIYTFPDFFSQHTYLLCFEVCPCNASRCLCTIV